MFKVESMVSPLEISGKRKLEYKTNDKIKKYCLFKEGIR